MWGVIGAIAAATSLRVSDDRGHLSDQIAPVVGFFRFFTGELQPALRDIGAKAAWPSGVSRRAPNDSEDDDRRLARR